VVVWNKFLGRIHLRKGTMEFVTNNPENPHINYFRNPVSGVNELGKLMKEVEDRLKYISDPVLIIQGSDDPVVNPISGIEIFGKLGTEKKQLVRIFARHHGILRGKEAAQVESKTLEFLKQIFSR
jgi:esterase/lipase